MSVVRVAEDCCCASHSPTYKDFPTTVPRKSVFTCGESSAVTSSKSDPLEFEVGLPLDIHPNVIAWFAVAMVFVGLSLIIG